ncbi:hypothetical protein BsWGS_07228 [Bradybaena similaris]
MAKLGGVTHLFAELSSLEDLNSLLGRSARLKYTCLSVSKKFLALGSNSGGVYIFSRDTLKYLQVVFGDTEASLVVSVSLSPSDQHVAIALSTGHVAVFELNIDRRVKPDRVRYTQDHAGHTVTALTWDGASARVFVGDDTGKISTIYIPNKGKSLFISLSEVIAYVESSVYQMEWWKDKLLVSTLTHTHLFDTIKQNYCTIGTKSRQGEYGSCFYMEPNSKATVIYCARPGSRMWEVDSEGKVLNTHQFKQLLAVPPTPVIRLGSEQFDFLNTPQTGQSVNFCKMFHISQFIITWSSKGLYLFDPINVKVMIWTQSFRGIKDMSVYNNDVYLFLEGGSIHRVTLVPIYQLLVVLCSRGLWSLSSSLLLAADQVGMRLAVIKKVKMDLLQDILAGLKSQGKVEIVEKVKACMEDVSEGSIESVEAIDDFMDSIEVKGHTYLPSGMVIVSEGVPLTQAWERKSLDKGNSLEADNVSNLQTRTRIGSDTVELQRSNTDMNRHSSNELPEDGKQKEGYKNEQIKNSVFINQENVEADRMSHSNMVSEWSVTGQFSEGDSEYESGKAQNEHLNLWRNADQETAGLDNSSLQSENYLLSITQSDSAQEMSSPSSSEIYDNHSQLLYDRAVNDVTIDDSLDNRNTYSAGVENVLTSNMQTIHSVGNVSLYTSVFLDDNLSKSNSLQSVDSVFNEKSSQEKTAAEVMPNSDVRTGFVSQSTARGFSASSESFLSTLESEVFPKENISDLSVSGSDKFLVRLQSRPREADIDDPYSQVPGEITDDSPQQDVSEDRLSGRTSFDDCEKVEASFSTSSQYMAPSRKDIQLSQSKQEQVGPSAVAPASQHLDVEFSHSDNNAVSLSKGGITSMEGSNPAMKFPPLNLLHTDNSNIAQPMRIPKKRRKKPEEGILRSASLDVNPVKTNKAEVLRTTVSVGDDQDEHFMQGLDLEMDSISIATISSIEEESGVGSPDSGSIAGDTDVTGLAAGHKLSPEVNSLMHPDVLGKLSVRKSSTSSYHGERHHEVIPPLIDRLNAAHRSASSDDMLAGVYQDSPSGSPLSISGEHLLSVGSPRASLSAFKDGLSLKLKTQTKSLIKTFKEKNPLNKSSSLSSPLAVSPLQAETSMKDGVNNQAQYTEQPDGLNEIDKMVRVKSLAVSAARTSALYIFALDIQAQLRSSSAIVRPVMLQKIMSGWAAELNLALCRYHEELVKRKNEMQLNGERLRNSETENSENNVETDTNLEGHEFKDEKRFVSKSNNGVFLDDSNLMTSHENQNMTSGINASSPSNSHEKLTQSLFSDVTPEHKNLTPTYWRDVMHCDDPFQLPTKHLDVIRTLTTMCFVSGATGGILSYCNFTEEAHFRSFVQAVLPPSVYELFNPDCTCLLSFFPGQHISDHNSHQHNSRHVNTNLTDGKQNQSSFGVLIEDAAGSSQKAAEVGQNDIVQEFHSSSLKSSLSLHEVKSKNSQVYDKKSKLCFCKNSSKSWNENEVLKQDVSMALFIRQFFFALDYEKVKQTLEKQKSRMFISWASLVLCCREKGSGDIVSSILADKQISPAIEYLRSGILPNQSALLGHIYRLFEMAPVKTSEFCGEIRETIKPVDVIKLCCLCSKSPSMYVLRYFKQAMISLSTTARPAVFSQLCSNRDVRYLLMETILSQESNDKSADGINR